MGESYLAGTEYRDSGRKEIILAAALAGLRGQRWQAVLRTDETTVLLELSCMVREIIRREDRIETGHLTLDAVSFELVNNTGAKVFFPLSQFIEARTFPAALVLRFDRYEWGFYAQPL
ncbi:Hypothetical protein DEACI_1660 [Acididesulfobacillus acetoxydans]|uniref:Uncharacterized protein n=1 Tax=Acididesulfobacillus acetoxydans TaxID=1561005 RepID=A0A8S0XWF9_9FIRM|nr:hypothetical protein [Acididesulfobacillus acetoxydans]CAA7601007.1 Hypothetical protein DEACI_1660 [Acididesulfobacillus acetoxydans]CEJ06881.1 Hypothetical protein DEACI_1334 [Acididesulfobacillus acetoxydans]